MNIVLKIRDLTTGEVVGVLLVQSDQFLTGENYAVEAQLA